MEGVRFPRYLPLQLQFLWFEADDLFIIFVCLGLAFLMGGIFLVSPIVVTVLYKRMKKNHKRGFLKHFLYSVGVSNLNGYPTSFEKRFDK